MNLFINTFKKFILLFVFALLNKVLFLFLSNNIPASWAELSTIKSFLWGWRFDFTAVSVLITLCLIFDLIFCKIYKKISWLPKLPVGLAATWITVTNLSDFAYLSESGRHVTYEVFTAQGSEFGLLSEMFTNFSFEITIAVSILLFFFFILKTLTFKQGVSPLKVSVLFSCLWLLIAVTSIRGGFHNAPQSPMSAYEIGSEQVDLVWNPTYSIIYYLIKGNKKAAHKLTVNLTKKEQAEIKDEIVHEITNLSNLKNKNIIFVLLESWPAADLKSYSGKSDAAPFFDKLRKESFTTHAMYSNGFRTVEGIFASLCSYSNPIGGGVAGTQLQTNKYSCLPKILKNKGWDTTFVQGSGKGVVGAFAQGIGFKDSFGKKDYSGSGEMNNWGYMDDAIYDFALEKIEKSKSPYFITINTGTTHSSELPKESDYVFGTDSNENTRRSVMHYADQSLSRFIEKLRGTITKPTLIVLMADHTAKIKHEQLKHVSLPFLMFSINDDEIKGNKNIVATQRDIAPTILDWLGGKVSWFTGQSMLKVDYKSGSDYSLGTSYFWIKDRSAIEMKANGNQELLKCYQIAEDTISLAPKNCSELNFIETYKKAKQHLNYTQQKLFDGDTSDY